MSFSNTCIHWNFKSYIVNGVRSVSLLLLCGLST